MKRSWNLMYILIFMVLIRCSNAAFLCYQCEGTDEASCVKNQKLVECGIYEEQECLNISFTYIENFRIKTMFKRDCAIRPEVYGECVSHHCLIAINFLSTDCKASCCKSSYCNARQVGPKSSARVGSAHSNLANEYHSWIILAIPIIIGQLILMGVIIWRRISKLCEATCWMQKAIRFAADPLSIVDTQKERRQSQINLSIKLKLFHEKSEIWTPLERD